jgi:hypothetical protein
VNDLVARLDARFRDGDAVQVATLVMAALVVTLAAVWPTPGQGANESWYPFAQARSVILALLALGYGASAAAEPPRRAVVTGIMVLVVALVAIPFDVAAYAASYPATPLWWSLVSIPLAATGYLIAGVGLGRLARALRVGVMLPILVPATLAGLLFADLQLGWTVFNPLTSALSVSPWFALAMGTLTLVGAVAAAIAWRGSRPLEVRT